ncbi:MAG: HlyD family efflux transporter periplasmic adaptor subunit [Clostridiales bacterium]|nr:HlyD family efflux transporter periplasmic adaptor subunit [Clostridiales bacterium]
MTKKKSVKRYILWGVLAFVVLWLALMPLMARQQQEEDGPQASILSANAAMGSIRTAIHGGGILEAGENEDITIPKDVKITEFLVKNGDFVSEGDPLAAVDKVSVMTAITEVQDSMSAVRKQITAVSDEKAATEVSATAGGRVKLVYAKEGDRVESVMLEHGTLAVLSLDSKMCVRLTVDSPLTTGESVTVTLADGKEVTGRVESNLSGLLVVTIEDKGYEVGQRVSVSGVGEGILEIHSPWNATAFAGTVSIVYAQPEQTLGSGAALFTLKDTDYTAQREKLAQTHRDYEELLQKLFKMHETGVISAPCDGLVSGIDKNSAHLLAAQEEEIVAQPLNAGEGEFRLVLLGEVMPLDEGSSAVCTGEDDCEADTHIATCPYQCTKQVGCTSAYHKDGCPEKCTNDEKCLVSNPSKHLETCPRRCTNTDSCNAIHHLDTCIRLCVHANEGQKCDAKTHYDDCIALCSHSKSESQPCNASKHASDCFFAQVIYKAVVAKVDAVGDELVVLWDASGTQYDVVKTGNGWALASGQSINESLLISKNGPTLANAGNYKKGDIIFYVVGYRLDQKVWEGVVPYRSAPAMPSFSMPSMNFNFSFSMPGMGGSSSTQTQLYDLDGDVLMTVTPQDTMTLTVAADESDISSVKTGMSAEITVNALPEEVFEGEITKVARSGSGNGGSSKFAVEITLPRQSEMLSGMSASAVISLYEKMNVLTLPAAALTEDGARTIVYTALDKKTGELASPVEVTTGLSDGEVVEILSGLGSGDTVYYAYYDTLEESDAVETDRMKMY